MNTIPNRFKLLLETKGFKQADLARILGKSKGNIGDFIRGKSKPSAEFLSLLAEKLDVNINWLLTGKGKMFTKENISVSDKTLDEKIDEKIVLVLQKYGLIEKP